MQPGGCMKKAKHVFMQPGGCMKMYFTPPVPKKPDGGSGGAHPPQWVWVSGSRPPPGSGSARITRNYPSRVQEGIWVGFGIG